MGVGSVLWETLGLISAYTTAGQLLPASVRPLLQNQTWPWVLLLGCFCVLWWEFRHPAKEQRDDTLLYRENIKHRERIEELERERMNLQETVDKQASDINNLMTWSVEVTASTNESIESIESQNRLTQGLLEYAKRIAPIQERLDELRRDAPRHLSAEARRIVTHRLRPAVEKWTSGGGQAAIQVRAMPGTDCASFTLEFEDLLESIGFHIIHARIDMTVANAHDDYRRGIYITQDKEMDVKRGRPSFGDALHEALLEANIPATKLERPGPGCSLCLIVGVRS
jgi:hypothetical protein